MTAPNKPPDAPRRERVLAQIAELQSLETGELRKRWSQLMDVPPPGSWAAMRQRLIYRVQELAYGGLSMNTRTRLNAIADQDNFGAAQPKAPVPGTLFIREWHGERHEVRASEDGFIWREKKYRSLTAVAKAITGQHCSGNLFFGITQRKKKGGGK